MSDRKFIAGLTLILLTASAAQSQQLFNNFPVNGLISAFQVNAGYSVSESFTLTSSGTAGEAAFGAWLTPGDSVTGISWSIGTTPFDTSLASGVAGATSSYNSTNADGYDVDTVTFAVPSASLPAGTYYLTLSGATTAGANPVYWDINNAAGVDAWSSSAGHVSASNTCFQVIGISGTCASSFQILSTNANVAPAPLSISFPSQTVKTTSTAQIVTVTNNGSGTATISGIAVTGANAGDFAQTNNCPSSLAASAFCAISVTFTPQAANSYSAAVTLTGSSPLSVPLSGTGTPPPPSVTLAPALTFANQTVNTTSAAQSVTLTNNGPGALTITSVGIGGANPADFAQTNNCPISPATLAISAFCTINVTFTPQGANPYSATVTVTDSGVGSPQSVNLSGTGTQLPAVTLAPALTFPNQTVNTTSTAQSVTLTNNGPGALTITNVGIGGTNPGDFAQTNNCPISPATLASGAFCTINVTFTPLAATVRSATIVVADNGAGSPQSVSLSGTGANSFLSWPNGYGYQATFTVAAGQVPSAQTNFPALISGTFADFATTANSGKISNTCTQTVGNNATTVPCDLIFTSDAAGTMPLGWEYETYSAATGAVNIWVNVPSLSNGTVIYAWYGQPSVTTPQTTPTATWGNSFEAVYHLKENPAGTAPQMNDSTANANHATMNGTVLASQQQPGEVDGSINFEGNTWAGLANPANFSFERTDSFSLSAWVKMASNSSGTLLSKLPASESAGWGLFQFGATNPVLALGLVSGGGFAMAETPGVSAGGWHYVVATYSGTSTVAGMQIYIDGVNQALSTLSNNLTSSIITTAAPVINGRGGPTSMSTDSLDEIRVSAKGVVLTPAWVTANYNNQSNPATFFTVSSGLTNAGGGSLSAMPTSVAFPNQTANTISAAQSVTLTNNGLSAVTITSIGVGGNNPLDFAQTNNCPISPATLAASAFCTVSVTFTPQAATPYSAAISVAGSSPLSVTLSGTGTPPPPSVTLAPALTFANQTVNTTSAAQSVTLTNNGPGALTITNVGIGGTNPADFAQTNNCPISPATLAISAFCTINVTFTPQGANPYSATVTVTDSGVGSPQSVNLSGTGTPPPAVTLASAITFPSQTLNMTSTAQGVTLTNNGPGALTIGSIGIGGTNPGDFAQTNNCPVSPATLAASAFCTINVTFTPKAIGARAATITTTDNGVGSPQSVNLNGTGFAPAWSNGYNYQATFTVAAGQVPSAQTNFPALISGTFADFATTANSGKISNTCTQTVGNNATTVPCDLIFTSDAAGTMPLNWEYETYSAATGAVNIWVNVPSLSNGTVIYAWYGQPSVTTPQTTPTATWSNSFEAVYHLKENPAGTAPQMNDSTANANHATMNGTVLASQQQPGEVDGSVNFEGNTWAGLANPANFSFERTDSFSLSAWVKMASNSSGTLLSKLPASESAGWGLFQFGATNPVLALGLVSGGGFAMAETPGVSAGGWHYVVATYSGTSTVAGMQIYIDGVNQALSTLSNNLTSSIITTAAPVINGRGGPTSMSTDSLDEIRVSAKGVVLTPAWVTANYNNQSNPATFFTVAMGLTN